VPIAVSSNVTEEDGQPCNKIFETTSARLKAKLRPILENKSPDSKVKVVITKVGDKKDTQYSVKELGTVSGSSLTPPAPVKREKIKMSEIDAQIVKLDSLKEQKLITEDGYKMAREQLQERLRTCEVTFDN
jgi:tartrate dehydratase beta subunit/fumarate hydratase class I family protein